MSNHSKYHGKTLRILVLANIVKMTISFDSDNRQSIQKKKFPVPLLDKSRAVSSPMPVLQPVMTTVLPSSLAGLVHTPPAK